MARKMADRVVFFFFFDEFVPAADGQFGRQWTASPAAAAEVEVEPSEQWSQLNQLHSEFGEHQVFSHVHFFLSSLSFS